MKLTENIAESLLKEYDHYTAGEDGKPLSDEEGHRNNPQEYKDGNAPFGQVHSNLADIMKTLSNFQHELEVWGDSDQHNFPHNPLAAETKKVMSALMQLVNMTAKEYRDTRKDWQNFKYWTDLAKASKLT